MLVVVVFTMQFLPGHLVALVHQEDLALGQHLIEGIIERFRALPMWRPAVLVGRSLTDLLTSCLCALVVAVTGLAVGWRTSAGTLSIIAGFALVLFFAYSLSWVAACVGLNSRRPRSRPPGSRIHRAVPARVHVQRAGADRAHARLAAGHFTTGTRSAR